MRTIKLLLLLLFSASLDGATYYVDYVGGLDANNGNSTGTAWKHAPAMQPFSGSYAHSAGDRFIFKGGVTWSNAALPLLITANGTSANRDYYGVDTNWFTGGAWSRPIFDGEGAAFTNHTVGNKGNVIQVNGDYVTIDNFEIKNFVWNNAAPTSIIDCFGVFVYEATSVSVLNVYIHDWVVKFATDGKFGGIGATDASAGPGATNCLIVAPTYIDPMYITGPGITSGAGIYLFSYVVGCEFVGVTQGIWGGGIVLNNTVRDGQDSFHDDEHENGAWCFGGVWYNNKFYNIKEGVGIYIIPGWAGAVNGKAWVWNNIFFNTTQILLTQEQSGGGTEIWFFNNVVKQTSINGIFLGSNKPGADVPFGKLVVQNNIFICTGTPSQAISVYDSGDLGANYTNDHNVFYTIATAAAVGIAQSNFFKPLNSVAQLVDQGVPFPADFSFDFEYVPRPQGAAWDIGPYESSSSSSPVRTVFQGKLRLRGKVL